MNFENINNVVLSKKLYPSESIEILEDLFNHLGLVFDETKRLDDQINIFTKEDCEKLIVYLLSNYFTDVEKVKGKPASYRFLFSKIIEQVLLKKLENIYYYNLYNDSEKREILFSLEKGLTLLHTLNQEVPSYILPSEISTLIIDGIKYTDSKQIVKALNSTRKRGTTVYEIKLNKEINSQYGLDLKEVFSTIGNLNIIPPLKRIVDLTTIKEIYLKKEKITNQNEILTNLLYGKGIYLRDNKYLTQSIKDSLIKVPLDFDSLVFRKDERKYLGTSEEYNIEFEFTSEIFEKYLILNSTGFTREGGIDTETNEKARKVDSLSSHYSIYQKLVEHGIPTKLLSKTIEFTPSIELEKISIDGREYTKKDINLFDKISSLGQTDIFISYWSDNTIIMSSKDLNYFYLLNQLIINKIKLKDKNLSFEERERLLFSPYLYGQNKTGRSLINFIETFLNHQYEDYKYEYDDFNLFSLENSTFIKKDILRYTRDYKNILDEIGKELESLKLFPKSFHELD